MSKKQSISRRDFIRVLALSSGGAALAACAPELASTTPEPVIVMTPERVIVKETVQVQVTAAAPPPLQAKLVWTTFRAPGTGWNEERIATFLALHPGVTIEFLPLLGATQQDNYGKMYALQAAGDLGDIIAFDPSHYQFMRAINKGLIVPLDDLVAGDGLDLNQWFEQFISIQYYQGKLYGLPSWGWAGYDTIKINTLHFDAAGIAVPDPLSHNTSMQTIGEWARSFRDEATGRWGLSFNADEISFVGLMRAFNGDLISADGTKSLVLESASVEALRWMYDLRVVDKVIPTGDSLGGTVDAAQIAGKLTMDLQGSFGMRNFMRDAKEPAAKASQVLLPERADGKFACQIRGGTWNIAKDSESPEVAYQFLKHIAGMEGSFGFNLVGQQGALVRPDTLELLIADNAVHEWFLPNLGNGIPAYGPSNSRGTEYTDAVKQWGSLLLDPKQPVEFEKGVQDLHDNIQLVLDTPAS